ncbi:hypothetical protein A2U01_0097463, partial [Trifolium medium]|nr:hypothetical protein [Trifolium medium]
STIYIKGGGCPFSLVPRSVPGDHQLDRGEEEAAGGTRGPASINDSRRG